MILPDEIHREVLEIVVKEFEKRGVDVLLLGSTAQLILIGETRGSTKDIDIYPLEIGVSGKFEEILMDVAEIFEGNFFFDVSSYRLVIQHKSYEVNIDIFLGFEKLELDEEILQFMERKEGFNVPSFEALIIMKLNAYIDTKNTDEIKSGEMLEDLLKISSFLENKNLKLDEEKLEKCISWSNTKYKYSKNELWEYIITFFGRCL